MKPMQWAGLITNASPHALPLGANVEQVNLLPNVAGQLTTRGGMRLVAPLINNDAYDVHGYVNGGYFYAIVLTAGGEIARNKSPASSAPTASPTEPTLSATGKQSATSYTQRCKSALEDL